MTKQDLNGARIAGRFVDDRCLGAPKRVSAVVLRLEANAGDSLSNEASILPRAHVAHVAVPGWEDEVVQRAAAALKPREQRFAGGLRYLKFYRSLGLLLHHDSAISDATASDYVADPNLDYVATAQLAIDREIEKRSVPKPLVLIEPEADRLNLLRFERALGFNARPSFQGHAS